MIYRRSLELYGLGKLREPGNNSVACPECRNELDVVSNGWIHGELFYCKKCQLLLSIALRKIEYSEEFKEHLKEEMDWLEARRSITIDNASKVIEFLRGDK